MKTDPGGGRGSPVNEQRHSGHIAWDTFIPVFPYEIRMYEVLGELWPTSYKEFSVPTHGKYSINISSYSILIIKSI